MSRRGVVPATMGVVAILVLSGLGGCAASSDGQVARVHKADSRATRAGTRTGRADDDADPPVWLLTRSALAKLITNPAVTQKLKGSRTDEILQDQRALPGFSAESVVSFTSSASLIRTVDAGRLPKQTYAVLYDPEVWSQTPLAEQRNPVAAVQAAGAAAHAHGLKLIVTPAYNLASVLDSGASGKEWRTFLDLNVLARMAPFADVIDLQAQGLERRQSRFVTFVRVGAAQAKAANRSIQVLAGLSTNPSGPAVSAGELTQDVMATRTMVSGYWLNIPTPGPYCPKCGAPRPDVGQQTILAVG